MNDAAELTASLRAAARAGEPLPEIGEIALAFSALDHPGVPLEPYRRHLAQLVRELAAEHAPSADADRQAEALRAVLAERHGYRGDRASYDAPENADLLRVIERRRGLPVSLGILGLHAARAQAWCLVGLRSPGHFLLRLEAGGLHLVLDPFDGFAVLDAHALGRRLEAALGEGAELSPDVIAPVSDREVLLRLANNIKARALEREDVARAAVVLERMLLMAPEQAELWRELGLVSLRQGALRRAREALKTEIKLSQSERGREEPRRLLAQIKAALH